MKWMQIFFIKSVNNLPNIGRIYFKYKYAPNILIDSLLSNIFFTNCAAASLIDTFVSFIAAIKSIRKMFSQRDKNVLNMIINPNMPFINADNAEKEGQFGLEDADYLNLPNYKQSELLNLEGVNLAEKGEFDAALIKFNEAIQICAGNPSLYNNRAQLHRLNAKIEEALADLEKSLELSKGKGRTAAQSFVQRAMVYRFQGKEELAKNEFEKAAELGSNFAKNQLVSMNPYAAMCNKMLGEIMTKFRTGE